MSKKYDDFMVELEALCKKHKVCISASGYDAIQVWDMDDGDRFIYSTEIEDMTDGFLDG